MQFLRLIFVKKLQLQLQGVGIAPWTPTGGRLRPPGPHFSADFSILNSHAWVFCVFVHIFLIIEVRVSVLFENLIIMKF